VWGWGRGGADDWITRDVIFNETKSLSLGRFLFIAKLLKHYNDCAQGADSPRDQVASLWHRDISEFVVAESVPDLFVRDKFYQSHQDILVFLTTWPRRLTPTDSRTTPCLFHIAHAMLTLLTDAEAEAFYDSVLAAR